MIEPELKAKERITWNSEKYIKLFIWAIIAFAAIISISVAKSTFFHSTAAVEDAAAHHFGAGGFTEYDLALAKELMDKDGDGICDVCGMDVNICIEGGQLQCNMGGQTDKLNIGILITSVLMVSYVLYLCYKDIKLSALKFPRFSGGED